jgi:catechol 2,3-dioxygenase-like lactoylglutathione lyase family enzyme
MNSRFGTLFLVLTFCLAAQPLSADRSASRPHIYGIMQTSILSTDMLAARTFYEKALGMKEPECNGCKRLPKEFFPVDPQQAISLTPAPTPTPSNLLLDVILVTDDLSGLRDYLAGQKVEVTSHSAEGEEPPLMFATDPEGRHIGFAQRGFRAKVITGGHPPTPPANGLHLIHAGFIVRDRAATEHFYKDILGFRPYWHGGMKEDQTDWVSMQVPDGTDWLEFMVNVSPDADQRVRGIMNHIAIGVTDIHATEQRLKDAGVNLTEQPKIGRDGKWQLNVYDPDQTRVEFMEFKPVQKPCCSDFTGPHPQP